MSDRDLLSVIVPVYNGQGYIRRCIDSICRASGKLTDADMEIIVIDDGSTDDSAAILKDLCREDDRIRVINLPDLGVSAARNRGVEEAKGQYLTFIDADDVIDEGLLKTLYEALKGKNAGFAGCRFFSFSDEDVKEDRVLCREDTREKNRTEITEYSSLAYIREEILKGNSRC
jgi:glycosyltransferase involved in cell wall biosynthesis